jgi:hypothetical protein
MLFSKKIIHGIKGKTVCYSINNIRDETGYLKFDGFAFFTPFGSQQDQEGYKYFDVPADQILVERDESLDKTLLIKVTESIVEAIEIYDGAEFEPINIGLEGDIVAMIYIPSDSGKDIEVEYKEVING